MDTFHAQDYLTQGIVLACQGNHEEALSETVKAEPEDPLII